jgi:hypothetical protein
MSSHLAYPDDLSVLRFASADDRPSGPDLLAEKPAALNSKKCICIQRDMGTQGEAFGRGRVAEHLAIDSYPNPEGQLASGQIQQHLPVIVGALPEPDLRCRCLGAEGLHYREIAEILAISLDGVSRPLARLARARRCSL